QRHLARRANDHCTDEAHLLALELAFRRGNLRYGLVVQRPAKPGIFDLVTEIRKIIERGGIAQRRSLDHGTELQDRVLLPIAIKIEIGNRRLRSAVFLDHHSRPLDRKIPAAAGTADPYAIGLTRAVE